MNRRHATRRTPKETLGFSWGRFPTEDGSVITYRLYRRDHRRAVHMHVLSVFTNGDRDTAAAHLRKARKFLRDKVDEIDLASMGVAA
ncbi:hypothetical protein [Stenotrophomonas tumulicola]|uniref:Uncharacterized protein n=1 Tax=Stenotrophomonas tumulicola TaxID=1685415 RepID=A0A7W3FJ24_9GAMM|nr:hypothetical protein [Stenotrophomonas tumulicola]MBA8680477.1 hypothetical protein [Stenotrophomonas tumulicola]